MIRAALAVARKDFSIVFSGGFAWLHTLLLGCMVIFIFSLALGGPLAFGDNGKNTHETVAAIFWLASLICQSMTFNSVYALEETHGQRAALVLARVPIQAVWLGKALAGFVLVFFSQFFLVAAVLLFLGGTVTGPWLEAVGMILLVDIGMSCLGSLLGAISRGASGWESLFGLALFPLSTPLLLCGIRLGVAALAGYSEPNAGQWFMLATGFTLIFAAAGLFLFPLIYRADG